MATLSPNLKLRLDSDLSADARYNLLRIDQLGSIFGLSNTGDQDISAGGDIRLDPDSNTLGGSGNGTVFAPNLTLENNLVLVSGAYTTTISTTTQTSNLTLTLPSSSGNSGQFLSTDGTGTLSWADPPTSNFASLNDTQFTSLSAGQIAQYDGSKWVNASIAATNQSGTFTWQPSDGVIKTITHNFNSVNIMIQAYDATAKCQVFINEVDYLDNNTIVLTADEVPLNNYTIFLQQVTNEI